MSSFMISIPLKIFFGWSNQAECDGWSMSHVWEKNTTLKTYT